MSDEYIPIYKGVAPGKKPKQKNLNTPKPLIVGAVKYNDPLSEQEQQAYYKMTPQEQAAVVNQRLRDQEKNAWPKNPMQNQHIINQSIKNNVSIYPTLPELGGYEYQQQNPSRPLGFWENPQRIVRFKDYIDKNPTAVLPEWLNKDVVNTAYEYLKYANNYASPDQWKALQEDSPVAQALKELPEPTMPAGFEQSVADTNSLENTVNPKDLTLYQRSLYGFMTPQPGKLTGGNVAQVGLSALGTGGGTSFLLSRLGTFFQALGISKNPSLIANPVGLTAAVIFGSATARQMVTGKELGAIETLKWLSTGPFGSKTKLGQAIEKKIDQLVDSKPGFRELLEEKHPIQFKFAQATVQKVFNFMSESVASAFGVIQQMAAGDDDFQEVVSNLGAAWKAGKLSYVALGKTANALLPFSEGKPLPEGYMWDISSGESKPVPIPTGFTVGAKALDNLRDQIVSDPDNWQKYKQDFISRFGVEGQLNDFALQTVLDPLNVAPYANAKLVEVIGKKQGNVALQYAGKFSQGNPVVDAIPFPFNGAVELISGGRLHGSKGFVGGMDAYKNFLQGNIPSNLKGKIPYQAPADYTRFQKMIAGLTDEGLPKRLQAQDPNKKAIQVAKELTPEAKALNFEYTLVDRLFYMNDIAEKDSGTLIKLITASAQADPTLTAQKIGDIFEEVGLARDFMDYREFNSPIGAAVATALKKAVDGGAVSKMVEDFNKTIENRASLSKYARFFGMDEATLLKRFKDGTNFDSLVKTYMADPTKVDAANSLFPNGDTSTMKIDLELFTNKDNPLPYNDSMLGYAIINNISDSLDGFLKERFGIKDNDPGWMRFSHTMKGLQSLAVLSLNPRYMLYNAVNNMITRIASNNYGYIDWDKFVAQYEPSVARQDIQGGFTQDLMNNTSSLFKNKNKTAKGSNFIEGGIDKAVRKIGDIFGFATKGSRAIETMESKQSFAVEYKNAMGKIRRVEIPAEIVKALPPDVVKTLKGILEGSSKVTDVDQVLSHINDPVVAKVVIDDVLSNFANSNEKIATSPDFYREILTKTGIYDELIDGINGAKNISDLATTFDNIDLHWNDYINKLSEIDIQSRVDDVISQVKTEGLPAAYSILSDMFMLREQTINGKWLAWDQLFAIKDIVPKDVWSRQYEAQLKINSDEFKRNATWQEETYKGIFEALGNKSPEADAFVKSFKDSNENFNSFFEIKNKKWTEHFNKDFKDYDARVADFNATKKTIEDMWIETQKLDSDINVVADRAMIAMSGNDPNVVAWRTELTKIRNQMTSEMTNFRKSLEQFTNPTIQQKNELYNKFIQETYMPLQAKLKDLEVSGAHDLFNSKNPITGEQPFGTTPSVPNQSMIATEGGYAFLQSLLNSIKASAYDTMNNPKPKQGIPPEIMPALKKFFAQEKQNLASDKYFAQSWAESQRDFVMLNYTKKTNFDNTLAFVFPYQFWYTNTMRNWALRMVDRPAIFNQYFRYRQAQENMERSGIPSRLEGKMSAFAPYLPDWMGDTLWSDPMAQLYPFSQALQPFNKLIGLEEDLATSAGYALNDMVKAGKISKAEAEKAKETMTGDLWNLAMSKATDESALSDPSSIVSILMQPGMQWDILGKLLAGHPEKILPTPAMKTGQAVESLLGAKAGSTPLTWLETNARKAIGMSESVAKYGQFGDYYVERMLSNMAFEGTISSRDAKEAMISHQGSAWEEADNRVAQELSLKTPGVLPITGALNGANFWQITTATFQSIFPQGLLPQGELIYKNQQQEYSLAYNKWKAGDKSALTEFYNEHPEYETRSALYTKDPEARLKQFLIGDIWDSYGGSGKANQRLITDALGADFETRFLNGGSESQAMIPLETLMIWSKTIGNTVPKPEAMPDFSAPEEVKNLQLWSENVTTAYDQFVKEREALYPMYYALQTAFYDANKSEQSAFLKANPTLKRYWDWKAQYEEDHPELAPVFASQAQVDVSKNQDVALKGLDPDLVEQLNAYYSSGTQLTAGAWELLAYEWEKLGRPYGTLKKWLSKVVEPAITGKSVPQEYSTFWTDSRSSLYAQYTQERDEKFPNYTALNEAYNGLPEGAQRKAFVNAYPELAEAWDFKKEFATNHPEIKEIFSYFSSVYGN